ncbi:hypothetical protein GCM10025778_15590 [Paeniglutamicibacter antarcticus]|uniref:Uncharacterized protein n=1 Tax=Paeniglutamicibacter antarcticus TaxID=494023 RepID=A0ABP9TLN4_9MICC
MAWFPSCLQPLFSFKKRSLTSLADRGLLDLWKAENAYIDFPAFVLAAYWKGQLNLVQCESEFCLSWWGFLGF